MPMSPEERRNNARRAALIRWSKESPDKQNARMREGLMRKFERQVDPENQLDPRERRRRAEAAHKAFWLENAAKSARARRKRKAERQAEENDDAVSAAE